ncbi:MAG: hypothetical protein K2P85_06905, partial [Flavobacteriaceae bacterium]|nr:hypothetical protein [Flavobacteriaceae bacterium]
MDKNNILNDLKNAQQKLIIHHKELEKCADELKEANENLDIGEIEKEKRLKEVNSNLKEMMFTISHKIRKSVANILGISKLLCEDKNLEAQIDEIIKDHQGDVLSALNHANKELKLLE